jgi:YfiH family protein
VTRLGRQDATTRPQQASWLVPNWPAPARVLASTTLRFGGYSRTPYQSFNLALGVGDERTVVGRNRALLRRRLALAREPLWLRQEHGAAVIDAGCAPLEPIADGSWTTTAELPCAVLTADCLPLLLCDRAGARVAAVHAGWRGLAAGVIEAAVARFDWPAEDLLAWLGPAIGPEAYEVGDEVRSACLATDAGSAVAFRPSPAGRWLADLYTLARRRLNRLGITTICGGEHCTYSDPTRFYSYRRDRTTGRMATLIWLRGATEPFRANAPKPVCRNHNRA